MPHVFLSYVREDSAAVDTLAGALSSNGVEVWMDRTSIVPGQRWDVAIRKAVRSGDFFIGCFSEHSVRKQRSGMNEELVLAVDELIKRPLDRTWFIPVLLTPCEIPEYPLGGSSTLRSIQDVRLYEHWQDGLEKLLNVVAPKRARKGGASQRTEKIRELVQLGWNPRDDGAHTLRRIADFGRDAVPIILEAFTNPPKGFAKEDYDVLIDGLGEIGSASAPAVQTIISHIQTAKPHGEYNEYCTSAISALGKIGGVDAISFLKELFAVMKSGTWYLDRLSAFDVLNSLHYIGDSTIVPSLVDAYLGKTCTEAGYPSELSVLGEQLSLLFPYRELYALHYFREAAIFELEKHNGLSMDVKEIRRCAAVASLDWRQRVRGQQQLIDALSQGADNAGEILFALQCCGPLTTPECIHSAVKATTWEDSKCRFLALKLLRQSFSENNFVPGKIIRIPVVSEVIDALQQDPDPHIRELANASLNSVPDIWEDVFHPSEVPQIDRYRDS